MLAAAVMVSPQLTAWFGVSQGELAEVPLLESFPPPEAGARKNVVAAAGDAARANRKIRAKFFILLGQTTGIMQKTKGEVAHNE